MSEKFTLPDGICKVCGIPWYTEEHDHKKMGTLSSEAALAAWQDKLLKEQEIAARAEEHAAKSGQ